MPARLAQQDDENIHAGRLRGRAGSPSRPPALSKAGAGGAFGESALPVNAVGLTDAAHDFSITYGDFLRSCACQRAGATR